jgi:hypothetical protein
VSLYRDPLAGLKSQVATKRGLIEQRERELAPLMRAMLPAALRQHLDEGRLRAGEVREEEESSVERLTAIDAAMDGLVMDYDEALALVPKLRECPLDVPDPPKPAQPPPWLIEENRQRFFRVRFEQRVREISPDAYVVRWGDLRYLARLHVAGAPLVAMTGGNFDVGTVTTEFTSSLRTSVHASAPRVTVRVKTALGSVAKALQIARDDETGDAEFDDAFLVDGPDGGALLLTPDVTAALRELAPWNVGLVVMKGIAEVSWQATFRSNGFELLHDAAFSVVLGIRAAIERA